MEWEDSPDRCPLCDAPWCYIHGECTVECRWKHEEEDDEDES